MYMGKFKDLTGMKFGRWTVIQRAENKGKKTYWECKCDCEKDTIRDVSACDLTSGKSSSCGCISTEKSTIMFKQMSKHNKCDTRLYCIWSGMKSRCYYKNSPAYVNYGGRGIIICGEWLDDNNGFVNFYDWAMKHEYTDELTINRIDNDGNYEPSNCCWETKEQQNRNKRSILKIEINNEIYGMNDLSKLTRLKLSTLRGRYFKGLRGNDLIKPLERERK